MTKLGFEFSNLPLLDKKDEHSVDHAVLNSLTDKFIEKGGKYFETSLTYQGGVSEKSVRLSLTEKHPRNSFILADNLPCWLLRSKEDCRRIFEKQLSDCGTDYFDIYLLQWLNEANYLNAEFCGAFDFLEKLKTEGKIIKSGFSFYDTPELLDKILTKHPETDYVRLQINFLDWESPVFRAKECYEVCRKHGKEIIAAEPLKNGFIKAVGISVSSAIRFAENLPLVKYVSAGSDICEYDYDFFFSEEELLSLKKSAETIRSEKSVPCAGCSVCSEICPVKIPVHRYFEIYNEYCRNPEESWKIEPAYSSLTRSFSRPSDCMRCRLCEQSCPQNINIVETLQKVSRTFGY